MIKRRFTIFTLIIWFFIYCIPAISQDSVEQRNPDIIASDTLKSALPDKYTGIQSKEIKFSEQQAIEYLKQVCRIQFLRNPDDPLKKALERLVFEASNPVFDSVKYFLKQFSFDNYNEAEGIDLQSDTLIIVSISKDTVSVEELIKTEPSDSLKISLSDSILAVNSSSRIPYLKYDTGLSKGDSIKSAVNRLLDFLEARDSSIVWFTGISGTRIPFMMNSGTERSARLWLRNEYDDSVTVWIKNHEPNTLGFYIENGVMFRRPLWQSHVGNARIDVEPTDKKTLAEVKKIMTRTQMWKYRTESSIVLSQGFLSNWVKGGESNVSTAFDITAYADYNNKPLSLSSNNFARIKYGLIFSDENGVRKNLDLLETNSKLNHKAFGKFDFSAIMLFKTQVAKGYNYPNDSVPVSRFFNPAILTVGLGLDYKPNKTTSLNFSPFSYKGTFVPDTAHIDQTKYGIAADRRSKNEPGASLMFMNEVKPFKNISVTNRLQLFTNYINNPLNIDVDWEMILVANLNWFTDVRFNTHLIFDDDTKTPVFDKDKKPVLGEDGVQKKSARIQFKELLGFSFVFRF